MVSSAVQVPGPLPLVGVWQYAAPWQPELSMHEPPIATGAGAGAPHVPGQHIIEESQF
jgi:hypothetical protein